MVPGHLLLIVDPDLDYRLSYTGGPLEGSRWRVKAGMFIGNARRRPRPCCPS
jgi:hypothetical protein